MLVKRYLEERLDRIDPDEKPNEFGTIRAILFATKDGAVLRFRQEDLFKSIIEEVYCGMPGHNPLIIATWINSCET